MHAWALCLTIQYWSTHNPERTQPNRASTGFSPLLCDCVGTHQTQFDLRPTHCQASRNQAAYAQVDRWECVLATQKVHLVEETLGFFAALRVRDDFIERDPPVCIRMAFHVALCIWG